MNRNKKYGLLIFWITGIMVFISGLNLLFSNNQENIPVINKIVEEDIDPSALFYSESDIPVRSERRLLK